MNNKDKFRKMSLQELRLHNELEAETAIATYFEVGNNGPEAKLASGYIASKAKDRQSENNSRLLDIKYAELNPEVRKLLTPKK